MTSLAELLAGDSALLLYFSESRTGYQNSTIDIPIYIVLCKLKVFLSIVAMIVRSKQNENCF